MVESYVIFFQQINYLLGNNFFIKICIKEAYGNRLMNYTTGISAWPKLQGHNKVIWKAM